MAIRWLQGVSRRPGRVCVSALGSHVLAQRATDGCFFPVATLRPPRVVVVELRPCLAPWASRTVIVRPAPSSLDLHWYPCTTVKRKMEGPFRGPAGDVGAGLRGPAGLDAGRRRRGIAA